MGGIALASRGLRGTTAKRDGWVGKRILSICGGTPLSYELISYNNAIVQHRRIHTYLGMMQCKICDGLRKSETAPTIADPGNKTPSSLVRSILPVQAVKPSKAWPASTH